MRNFLLGIGVAAVAAFTFAADEPQPPGGPVRAEEEVQGKLFKMHARSSQGPQEKLFNYTLDLHYDKFLLVESETAQRLETSVYFGPGQDFVLEVERDRKGAPTGVRLRIKNRCSYYDLNGDGIWDAAYDDREEGTRKRLISVNGGWVRVMDGRLRFQEGAVDYHDQQTAYYWDGKVWSTKKPSK